MKKHSLSRTEKYVYESIDIEIRNVRSKLKKCVLRVRACIYVDITAVMFSMLNCHEKLFECIHEWRKIVWKEKLVEIKADEVGL